MSSVSKRGEVIFLLCEDVRAEYGNKLSILGLFAGNDILFPTGSGHTLPSLAILLLLRGMQFRPNSNAQLRVKGPRWPVNEPVTWPLQPEAETAAFMFKVQNVDLGLGEYRIELSIGAERHVFGFRVAEQPPAEIAR